MKLPVPVRLNNLISSLDNISAGFPVRLCVCGCTSLSSPSTTAVDVLLAIVSSLEAIPSLPSIPGNWIYAGDARPGTRAGNKWEGDDVKLLNHSRSALAYVYLY